MLLPEHPATTDSNEINIRGGVAHLQASRRRRKAKKDEREEAMRRRRAEAKAAKKDEAK